jgi:benzodiazapine receptor
MNVLDAPDRTSTTQLITGAAVLLFVTFSAATVGSAFTETSRASWYEFLARPTWTPPRWTFGPVWSVLYTLMAIAAWLVWRAHGLRGARVELTMYAAQLGLNVLWSALFFGARSPGAAFVEILVLWVAIAATTVAFWRRVPAAGVLFLPYLGWVAFAAALNWQIWRMN